MSVVSLKYLPWSGRRYRINQFGEVVDSFGEIIKQIDDGHEVKVEIEWISGKRLYSVAVLVLFSYEKLSLPDHLLDQIEPLYRDGSRTNLCPANLLYRFKCGKIEVEEYPGFYYIPMYTNYAISEQGVLINVQTRQPKTWSITKSGGPKNQTGGYHYTRVVTDSGFSRVLFKHRALCMTFKPYGGDMPKMVVNHLDGVPGNNDLKNLEWTTYKKNNEHALLCGLKKSYLPVLVKDLATGEVIKYPNASECGRKRFGKYGSYVLARIAAKRNFLPVDGIDIKFDDGSEWKSFDNPERTNRSMQGNVVLARNVYTGEIFKFSNCREASRLLNLNDGTILKHVKTNEDLPLGGYNFRYEDELTTWPTHPERNLLIYKDFPTYPRDGVVMTDMMSGQETFFTSTAGFCNKFKLSKSGYWDHVLDKKLYNGRYLIESYKLKRAIVHQ